MTPFLTTAETAAYLNVSLDEVRDLRRQKHLAFVKLGYRTIRFRIQDLEAFINRRRVSAIGEAPGRPQPSGGPFAFSAT